MTSPDQKTKKKSFETTITPPFKRSINLCNQIPTITRHINAFLLHLLYLYTLLISTNNTSTHILLHYIHSISAHFVINTFSQHNKPHKYLQNLFNRIQYFLLKSFKLFNVFCTFSITKLWLFSSVILRFQLLCMKSFILWFVMCTCLSSNNCQSSSYASD